MSAIYPWDIVPTLEFSHDLIAYRDKLDELFDRADRSEIPDLLKISDDFDLFIDTIYSIWEYKTAYYKQTTVSGSVTHKIWTAHYTSFYARNIISLHGLSY